MAKALASWASIELFKGRGDKRRTSFFRKGGDGMKFLLISRIECFSGNLILNIY